MKWTLECVGCGKKASFKDVFAIAESKWRIVGWNVPSAEPKCVCPDCEYGKPKKK